MMTKIVNPAGWDWERPVAKMVKASSGGLTHRDKRALVKEAGPAFADMAGDIEVKKGEVPVHLIALGATENVGPNRNADRFSESTCRKYHDTFRKKAKFYRNHENKDPSKSYGYVKLSAYNPDMRRVELLTMLNEDEKAASRNDGFVADKELEKLAKEEDIPVSMACVTDPDKPVLTRDRGYVRIADIRTGDYVWTHNKRWRRVKQLNRRRYTGEIVHLRVEGDPETLSLTADHPMWAKVFSGSREREAVKAKSRWYFNDAQAFERDPSGWTCAEHLGHGDRLFYNPITEFPGYGRIANEDLASLAGYYLAEGSIAFNGDNPATVQLACNNDDSLPRRVPAILRENYPDVQVDILPHPKSNVGLEVRVHSSPIARVLHQLFGRGCRGKTIPPEIFNADEEVKLAFLGAWLDGDGWLDKKGAHWSSADYSLVLAGRDLLASIGIPSSIYRIQHPQRQLGNQDIPENVEYTLNVSHIDGWGLAGHSWKAAAYEASVRSRSEPASMRCCPDGTYALRVKDVNHEYVADVETYNIEVEEDESYSLGGFISHNCSVPYDTCTHCQNEAPDRSQYCTEDDCVDSKGVKRGGCKHNLGQVYKDGHIQSVDNPITTWFDISHVSRPADRIAYGAKADYLQKAASADRPMGGAELADALGITAPRSVVIDDLGQQSRDVQLRAKIAYAFAVAPEPGTTKCAMATHPQSYESAVLPQGILEKLGSPGTSQSKAALAALADQGVLLRLADFARWTGREELAKEASYAMAGIFDRILDDQNVEQKLASSLYIPGGAHASGRGREAAFSLRADRGILPESAQHRAMRAGLRGATQPADTSGSTKLAFTVSGDSYHLAQDYALYKIGAVQRMLEQIPDLDFGTTLATAKRTV